MQYRKKPVIIEAFQMTQERRHDNREWPEWLHKAWNKEYREPGWFGIDPYDLDREKLLIWTLEGAHNVTWGDWIIKGIKGELYPCKPDIFEATYEETK